MRNVTILLLFSANNLAAQSIGHAEPPSASVKEMIAYPLTLVGLDHYTQASRAMSALLAKQPDIAPKLRPTGADTPNSIEETVAFTKKRCPECVATVERTMPYKDYVLFQGALVISYISAARPRPNSQVHIPPENLKFVLVNRAKIEGVMAEQRTQPDRKNKPNP